MDVHDVGDYRVEGRSRILEPGMVVTVEPGLYFDPERESVTFVLHEFSEEEMWDRRLRLGMSAAKRLEEEEKAKAPTLVHAVPPALRGIGVRIEDDVLITGTGHEVLTSGAPKTIADVERTCTEVPRLPRP
jgi:Xaa-Pro aminopeptidase